jgi:endonuclease-3
MQAAQRAVRILKLLGRIYKGSGMTDLGNPEDTLLATLLSAQTTDVQVLRVYPVLRKRFPTLKTLAEADWQSIAQEINSVGLYRTKAKAIKKLAQVLLDEFGGRVPSTMEELTRLPGVGRKTASVVLSFVFHQPAIAVDTHVLRIAKRLGWSKARDPKKMELDLRALVPEKQWSEINRILVPFGREICQARQPQCWRCPIADLCPYPNKSPKPAKA